MDKGIWRTKSHGDSILEMGAKCKQCTQEKMTQGPGQPMLKSQYWMANFNLSGMELRCRLPLALLGSTHKHAEVRGKMKFEGRSVSVAEYSGAYSPVQGTLYARSVARAVEGATRPGKRVTFRTELVELAQKSKVAGPQVGGLLLDTGPATTAVHKQFEIGIGGAILALDEETNVPAIFRTGKTKEMDKSDDPAVTSEPLPTVEHDTTRWLRLEGERRVQHDKEIKDSVEHGKR